MKPRTATTVVLGITQIIAWGSSYYLPAVLASAIGKDIGIPSSTVFGAFSVALLVAACIGPFAGRLIDRLGGRPILIASNLVFAAGLIALSQATNVSHIFAAWVLIGLAMGSGLYEAAFATVVRLHGQEARGAITGITLFAGFAGTVGWPLSAYLENSVGWRGVSLVWAGLHLFIALPLHVLLPRAHPLEESAADSKAASKEDGMELSPAQQRWIAVLLSYVFAVTWFISTAMAAHLPELLLISGTTLVTAVGVAALVGPAQVAGRVIEFTFLKRAHPLLSARLAALAHPLGALLFGLLGTSAAAAFAVLHGLGNGILTIAIGTLPLLIFGPSGYGQRQGRLMAPARVVQAGAPFLFGAAMDLWGAGALWLSAALGISAFFALLRMSTPKT